MKVIAFVLILALGIAWVAIVISLLFSTTYIYAFFPIEEKEMLIAVFSLFVLVGVPILYIVFFTLRIAYGTKVRMGWKILLSIFWFISLTSLGMIAKNIIEAHGSEANITTKTPIPTFPFDTLIIDFEEDTNDYFIHLDNAIKINKSTLAINQVNVSILESPDDNFQWGTTLFSQGKNPEEAANHAENISFDLQLDENHLILPSYIYLKDGQKWHDQKVFITIWVPVGKSVQLSTDIGWHHDHIEVKGDASALWDNTTNLWQMEKGGLVYKK